VPFLSNDSSAVKRTRTQGDRRKKHRFREFLPVHASPAMPRPPILRIFGESPAALDGTRPASTETRRKSAMSYRVLAGAVAAVIAILTLIQLLWMFGMFSPADALGGRNGAVYASALAAWFLITLAPLAAAAIILLMTRDQIRAKS